MPGPWLVIPALWDPPAMAVCVKPFEPQAAELPPMLHETLCARAACHAVGEAIANAPANAV
ncbi:hypothetical protein Acid7E03_26220 [Acidisoma sp. 7E03]